MVLLYIGGMIKAMRGHKVCLLDAVVENTKVSKTKEIIDKYEPDLLVILTGAFTYENDLAITAQIEKRFTKIVAVGEGSSVLPSQLLQDYETLDYAISGEPECAIKELIEMEMGLSKRVDVGGLCYRENSEIKEVPRKIVEPLDELPFPDRSLISNEKYHCVPFLSGLFTDLMITRSCVYKCKFCSFEAYWGKVFRTRSPENVISEVTECRDKFGIREFFILDDLFLLNKKNLTKLCKGFQELDINWAMQTRVDLVTKESLHEMANAGLVYVHYGAESGSQRILDYYKKEIKVKQIEKAVKWTVSAGVLTCATFIIGNPEERPEDIEKTINLAKELPLDFVHYSPLIPQKASPFFNEFRREGLLKHEDYTLYTKPNIIFKSKYLMDDQINNYIRKAYKSTLLSPRFVFRSLKKFLLKGDFKGVIRLLSGGRWVSKLFLKSTN